VQEVHKSEISKTTEKSSVGVEQHTSVLLRVPTDRVVSGGKGFPTTLFLHTEESYRVLAFICLSGTAHPLLLQASVKSLGNVESPQALLSHHQCCRQPRWKLEQSRSCSRLHCCVKRCQSSPETWGKPSARCSSRTSLLPCPRTFMFDVRPRSYMKILMKSHCKRSLFKTLKIILS